MIIRSILESVRGLTFGRERRALQRRAIEHRFGILRAVGSGYLMPDIQEYEARGESGDYRIFVVLPSAPPGAEGYPVLYLLDGNACIAGVAEALRLQTRFARESEVEPTVVVAVGYPGAAPIHLGRRAYDYLPKHESSKLSARFMQGAPWHQPGGAEAFRAFLTGPLREDIARRYPVDRRRQMLCGHSFGGYFGLHSFLAEPGAFSKIAALSPALWWDDGSLMTKADAMIGALPPDLTSSLLLAVGERETPERPHISQRMTADAQEFAAKLKRLGPAGVDVHCRVVPGENHQSLITAMFPAVLRFIAEGGADAAPVSDMSALT